MRIPADIVLYLSRVLAESIFENSLKINKLILQDLHKFLKILEDPYKYFPKIQVHSKIIVKIIARSSQNLEDFQGSLKILEGFSLNS